VKGRIRSRPMTQVGWRSIQKVRKQAKLSGVEAKASEGHGELGDKTMTTLQ